MKTVLKYVLSLLLGGGLLWYIYRDQDLNLLLDTLKGANFVWIGVCVFVGLLAHLSRAIRWKMLLEPLNQKPSNLNTFNAVMTGYVGNIVVPRAGEVSRCAYLYKTDNVPIESGFGTVVTERLFDLLSFMIVTGIAVLLEFDVLGKYVLGELNKNNGNSNQLKYIVLGVLLALALAFFYIFNKYKATFLKYPIVLKIWNFLIGLAEGIMSIKNLKNPLLFIFHSVFIWLMYFAATYCLFKAFHSTELLGVNVAIAIFVFGSLGMIIPTPGGAGSFHFFVTVGLTLYGISQSDAGIFAAIAHATQTFGILLIWLIGFLVGLSAKKTA